MAVSVGEIFEPFEPDLGGGATLREACSGSERDEGRAERRAPSERGIEKAILAQGRQIAHGSVLTSNRWQPQGRIVPTTTNRVPHRPLPRLRGRDREGARNKAHLSKLTPSPTLPRKREREQTEFAARLDSIWQKL